MMYYVKATTPRRPRRGRTPLPESERKARLIQTRVDEDLDDALRDAAKQRRVTVSQLIRNVLEDTFTLVDNVVADAAALTATVKRDAKRVADAARGRVRDPLESVEAWQEVIVGKDQICARCGNSLTRGARALLGVVADGSARPWMCTPCSTQL